MALIRILELIAGSLLLIAMYWAPTLVAFGRRAQYCVIIVLLNTLLGWTVIGWLAALIWSVLAKPEQQDELAPAAIATDSESAVAETISADPLIAH